jgi:hypothetical protein
MMKSYLAPNRLPVTGMILLLTGSIILGVATGALAYFISNLIYFIFVFPLVIGGASMIAYYRLLQFAKVRHSLITALMGFVMGTCVAASFYGIPYLVLRNNFVIDAQEKYQVDAQTASKGFDTALMKETGSSGFVGFMKLRAREGDKYTNYIVVNSLPIHEFGFTLKSTWAWIYWIVEVFLIALPIAWIGFDVGKRAFNQSANDWYNPLPKQIGSTSLESKEKLFALLQANDLQGISELMVSEGELLHPMLEIYEQHSNNKKGDILLSVKQTFIDNRSKIKRNISSQWEIPQQEYSQFVNVVNRKFAE